MPTLSIDIPAQAWTRVQAAFGDRVPTDTPRDGAAPPATEAEVATLVKEFIADVTAEFERREAARNARDAVGRIEL